MSRAGSPISLSPIACAALLMLAACALQPAPTPSTDAATADRAPAPIPPRPPANAAANGAADPARAGEPALVAGLRAYDHGQYKLAERRLLAALEAGLAAPRDRAAAHKTLAFLYCASQRVKSCERAFRAARAADPSFVLTKAEAGHPQWGPVYRRVFGLR